LLALPEPHHEEVKYHVIQKNKVGNCVGTSYQLKDL